MFKNYLKIILRNLSKNKLYSFINISGLAIGMTSAILILLWVQDELNYDKFHEKKNELYQVFMRDANDPNSRGGATVPFALAPILKQEFPEIIEFTRMQLRSYYESCMLKYDNKVFYENGILLVDPSFFNMLSYRFIKGNPATALSNINSMVITKDIATKYFGDDEPLGKVLKFNNRAEFIVTGVIENVPHNSEIQFDIAAPIQNLGEEKLTGWSWESSSLLLLQKNISIPELQQKIAGTIEKHLPLPGLKLVVMIHPLTQIHLHYGDGDIRLIYVFLSVAIFILVIACINYMNLTTARFNRRAKEVGLRKVVGAHRGALIRQFFNESISLSIIALLIAYVLVEILLSFFNNLTDKNLVFLSSSNYLLLFGLIGLAVIVGIMAGSYPAFFLSSFQPAIVLRGLLKSSTKSPVQRTILVVTQFAIAIILIICTIVVYRQHDYMIHKKLGYNKDQIIFIPINQELKQKYVSFKNKLLQNPDIKNVTVASSLPNRIGNTNPIEWEGKTSEDIVFTKFAIVDREYIETFQMKLLEGRNFLKESKADFSNFIINKRAAELMHLPDPVNKQASFMGVNGKIIGVIDDFHNRPLDQEINPLILTIHPDHYDYFLQAIFVKINTNDMLGTLKSIENIAKEFAPDFPFEFNFLDETVDNYYRFVQRMGYLLQYFALLAIFISCLGLFALASFMSEQRTKEIGVRKTLGASVSGIVLLLSREFTKWVLLANLIAWPIAWIAMGKWLQNFAYRINIGWFTFLLAGTLALIIALITVSYQSIKAALANPVESLRYE